MRVSSTWNISFWPVRSQVTNPLIWHLIARLSNPNLSQIVVLMIPYPNWTTRVLTLFVGDCSSDGGYHVMAGRDCWETSLRLYIVVLWSFFRQLKEDWNKNKQLKSQEMKWQSKRLIQEKTFSKGVRLYLGSQKRMRLSNHSPPKNWRSRSDLLSWQATKPYKSEQSNFRFESFLKTFLFKKAFACLNSRYYIFLLHYMIFGILL